MESYPGTEKNLANAHHNLIKQIKNSMFTFQSKIKGNGLGFFCNFRNFPQQNPSYILIINNIFLDKEDIAEENVLNILLNESNQSIHIKIDDSRQIYRDPNPEGITIIEILESDELGIDLFLEIDLINEKNGENSYLNKDVYLVDCSFIQNPELYLRKINNINSKIFEIENKTSDDELMIGSPIIKSDDFKLIGFHLRYNIDSNCKLGLSINESIHKYTNQNSIPIIYKNFGADLKLFGETFIKNNKDKCKMIVRGKKMEICQYLKMNIIEIKSKTFQIILTNVNKLKNLHFMFNDCDSLYAIYLEKWDSINLTVTRSMFNGCTQLKIISGLENLNLSNVEDIKCMFNDCESLETLPDISKWKTSQVRYMEGLFNGCSSLKELPDISKWNTSNVVDMSFMFSKCSLLKSLPNISNWDTQNVENMMHIFECCQNLTELPDISKWNTKKVENLNSTFHECSKLKSLPDISKWKIENVSSLAQMFDGCSSLISIPDISNWNTKKVVNISKMFSDCSSLVTLPDISNWDLTQVKDMNSLFNGCSQLLSLPDISKWKLDKMYSMYNLFNGCSSLLYLRDISKWNTENVTNMSSLFANCLSLIGLPDISKWNVGNVTDMSGLFYGCSSLNSLPEINKWDTKNVRNMNKMFKLCSSLVYIPFLKNFKDNTVRKNQIFEQCTSLIIKISN